MVTLDAKLKKADKDAQVYNSREMLLGLDVTDYTQVGGCTAAMYMNGI